MCPARAAVLSRRPRHKAKPKRNRLPVTPALRREISISISVGKGMYGQRLKIADAAGATARVGIEVPFSRGTIIAGLRRCAMHQRAEGTGPPALTPRSGQGKDGGG